MSDKVIHLLTFIVSTGALLALILTGHDPSTMFSNSLAEMLLAGAVGGSSMNTLVAMSKTRTGTGNTTK